MAVLYKFSYFLLYQYQDFQDKPLIFIANKLEISVKELHREMKDMKIFRAFRTEYFEII